MRVGYNDGNWMGGDGVVVCNDGRGGDSCSVRLNVVS